MKKMLRSFNLRIIGVLIKFIIFLIFCTNIFKTFIASIINKIRELIWQNFIAEATVDN